MVVVYGVVYRVTCLVNGKLYHGQTVNPDERWSHHLRADSHCHALRNALAKYGRHNFIFEIIASASSKEELDALEVQWVSRSLAPVGYNIKEGGANGRLSEETRRKISASNKVAQNRPEVKARNSAGVRKAMAKPEVKEKHRAALKKSLNSPENKELHRLRMLEVHARPGEKEKRSQALCRAWASYSPAEREQRCLKHKAAYTDEQRARARQTSKEVLSRPEVKARLRAGQIASWTPERRAQHSAKMKDIHADSAVAGRRRAAISKTHNTPEGKGKLARRRRRGESQEAWQVRIRLMDENL